ncbi:Transcription elongation factor SPT4 [Tyrophagus putrescentiae]|nr:Transcription elongation factor SPT4 [Tyrophagus putrescentiae]
MAELEAALLPYNFRSLRACLLCSLVKSFDMFEENGCENCDQYLGMKNNRQMIYDCTSNNFEGIIGLMSPRDSWVARWKRITRNCPGMYALTVSGHLPEGIINGLKERGVVYGK